MCLLHFLFLFFFSSRRRHTRFSRDWSSDVCSSDLLFLLCTVVASYSTAQTHPEEIRLKDFRPVSIYKVPATKIEKARYPAIDIRSEERRVGKDCRCGWSTYHQKNKVIMSLQVVRVR